MAGEENATSLEAVKRKLRITYSDAETDARVREIAEQAECELRVARGIPDDQKPFEKPGAESGLLLNLCFYEWNDAGDEFWSNYEGKVAQCREKWTVMAFAKENEGDDVVQ